MEYQTFMLEILTQCLLMVPRVKILISPVFFVFGSFKVLPQLTPMSFALRSNPTLQKGSGEDLRVGVG